MRFLTFKAAGIALLITVLFCGSAAFWFDRTISTPIKVGGQGFKVVLERGNTIASVAADLVEHKLIDWPQPLIWYARMTGQDRRVKMGEYWLTEGMTSVDLVKMLVVGRVIQYPVTFIEGSTFGDVRKVLAMQSHLEPRTSEMTAEQVMDAIGLEGISAEGRFFPDTYLYTAGTTDLDLLRRSADKMQKFLRSAWDAKAADLPYSRADDALVMASIIEKETGSAGERDQIAGVFVRRLQLGMRLQSDPTVIFGMGKRYKGNITRADLRRTTAYNTYRINGLPPTPIALPGKASIEAALHPLKGDALYFVGKGDGSHYFSATLAQHQNAVERYQRSGRSKNYRSSPARELH